MRPPRAQKRLQKVSTESVDYIWRAWTAVKEDFSRSAMSSPTGRGHRAAALTLAAASRHSPNPLPDQLHRARSERLLDALVFAERTGARRLEHVVQARQLPDGGVLIPRKRCLDCGEVLLRRDLAIE